MTEDIERGISALKLFNEKAKKLQESNFLKHVLQQRKIQFTISAKRGEPVKMSTTFPDVNAIDAFVLTFRFVIQNNERCSFGNLGDAYSKLSVSKEIKEQYTEARQKLNEYLDSKISFVLNKEHLSRRKVLDIFVYGGLAHANPEKKKIYDKWVGNPIVCNLFVFEFVSILFQVLRIIRYVAQLNVKVIEMLQKDKHHAHSRNDT